MQELVAASWPGRPGRHGRLTLGTTQKNRAKSIALAICTALICRNITVDFLSRVTVALFFPALRSCSASVRRQLVVLLAVGFRLEPLDSYIACARTHSLPKTPLDPLIVISWKKLS
jgi:hypothetical protein